jgi:hypothetical protein
MCSVQPSVGFRSAARTAGITSIRLAVRMNIRLMMMGA